MRIILASKSPARAKLLAKLGLKFEIMPSHVDEDQISEPVPSKRVKKLAVWKAETVLGKLVRDGEREEGEGFEGRNIVIISADTMVYLPKRIAYSGKGVDGKEKRIADSGKGVDGKNSLNAKRYPLPAIFIGKPSGRQDAKNILMSLSDTTHWLFSGFCVLHYQFINGKQKITKYTGYDKSKVTFKKLIEKEIDVYVSRENVHLWAGAYTIESGTPGANFIKKIEGSGSNVLGLPVGKLKKILKQIKLPK